MNENLKKFLEAVSRDRGRIERLKAMTEEAQIIAFAAELGFTLTAADFGLPEGELDEKELTSISGGVDCGCVCSMVGGGGGTDSNDGRTYGCACVGYGQGGDGSIDDFNCMCPLAGTGLDDPSERPLL